MSKALSEARALKYLFPLLLLLVICSIPAYSSAEENLLADPDIEGLVSGIDFWETDAWDESRTYFGTDTREDGGSCLYIFNYEENDARYIQSVNVEPDTVYRASCKVKAAGCEGGAGANLSILYTDTYSDGLYDTAGEWMELAFYGMTGSGQTSMVFCARLGGYSATTSGEAWFDDLVVEKAHDIPEDAVIHSFENTYASPEKNEKKAPADAKGSHMTKLLALSGVWALLAALIYLKGSRLRPASEGGRLLIWVFLAFSLVVRVAIAAFSPGYETDIGCFISWAKTMYAQGPSQFYTVPGFCDYPPGYMLMLWPIGLLISLTKNESLAVLLVKLPNILSDIFCGWLIWKIARPRYGDRTGAYISLLFLLNAAVICDSAVWGQTDSILSVLVICAVLLCGRKKYAFALPVFAIAVLVKPQALLFAPIGLCVLITDIRRRKKIRHMTDILSGLFSSALILYAAGFVSSMNIPDISEYAVIRPVIWLYRLYTGTLSQYNYYSVSACNFWHIVGLDWSPLSGFASQIPGWAAYLIAIAGAAFLTVRAKGKGHLPLICSAMISFMFCFGLKMHERYLFPVLPLLVFAYIEERDVRTVCSLILASVGCFLNMEAVLIYGYTIHAPAALTISISAMNIASCAILIWAGVDICIFKHTITLTRIYRRAKSARALHAPALSRLKAEEDWRINLKKGEIILMAAITLAYSIFTFANLGTRKAPETDWISSEAGETVTFDLGAVESFTFTYYGGICNCTFDVSISQDGSEFTSLGPAQYDQGEIFRWLRFEPEIPTQDRVLTARYLRITAQKSGLVLRECGFLDGSGDPLLVRKVMTSGSGNALALIDEQDTVPPYPSYYNSSYFDEIYHVRTAYEHIHGMSTYEWTHPPLGKLLIACGILLFGMNPFGWRFAGAVAGIIMVPLMYLIIRQLTKNRFAAFFGMMLLTLDCMHFTQTRIGTIDSFAVMFIMFMYLFMFRYVKMSFYRQPLKKTLVPLALCGTAFALGCASKWICIYAGAGLAVLFFYTLSLRYSEYRAAGAVLRQPGKEDHTVLEHAADAFPRYTVMTLFWCCLFFIAVPLAVYYFSYYWQLTPDNNFTIKGVWDTQVSIFRYHNSLSGDTHYFRSPWYEWPLIIRPMWYYSGTKYLEEGMISSISCMGNPAVWWGSLVGIFYAFFRSIQSRGRSRPFLIVSIAFLSQFAPWILISRSTFIYHYFASVPFIIAASALMVAELYKRSRKAALILGWSWMGAALALCAMFYPLMSGLPIPRSYAKYLRWFRWYNY